MGGKLANAMIWKNHVHPPPSSFHPSCLSNPVTTNQISEKELAELVKQDRSSLPPSSQFSVSDEQNINLTSALAAGGLFALSPSIWSYAIQAEVFPLNNLLIAMTTYLWIMYRRAIINENWTTAKIMGLLGALGCGLAISNQHTSMVHAGKKKKTKKLCVLPPSAPPSSSAS